MKRIITIITLLVLLVGYLFFFQKQSKFIAGEYRYYTLYEVYQAKEKYIDYAAKAYEKDVYNLKTIKNDLIRETDILDKYLTRLRSYNDSLNLTNNNVYDYKRYISNLKRLKLNIDNQKEIVLNYENELNKLVVFITKLERDELSIRMYKSDITNINSVLKTIDSTTKKHNSSLTFIQNIAELRSLMFQKQILENREIERQNQIAELERKRELENQQTETNSEYSSNNYVSDYSRFESTRSYDLPNTYYPTPSVSSI